MLSPSGRQLKRKAGIINIVAASCCRLSVWQLVKEPHNLILSNHSMWIGRMLYGKFVWLLLMRQIGLLVQGYSSVFHCFWICLHTAPLLYFSPIEVSLDEKQMVQLKWTMSSTCQVLELIKWTAGQSAHAVPPGHSFWWCALNCFERLTHLSRGSTQRIVDISQLSGARWLCLSACGITGNRR